MIFAYHRKWWDSRAVISAMTGRIDFMEMPGFMWPQAKTRAGLSLI